MKKFFYKNITLKKVILLFDLFCVMILFGIYFKQKTNFGVSALTCAGWDVCNEGVQVLWNSPHSGQTISNGKVTFNGQLASNVACGNAYTTYDMYFYWTKDTWPSACAPALGNGFGRNCALPQYATSCTSNPPPLGSYANAPNNMHYLGMWRKDNMARNTQTAWQTPEFSFPAGTCGNIKVGWYVWRFVPEYLSKACSAWPIIDKTIPLGVKYREVNIPCSSCGNGVCEGAEQCDTNKVCPGGLAIPAGGSCNASCKYTPPSSNISIGALPTTCQSTKINSFSTTISVSPRSGTTGMVIYLAKDKFSLGSIENATINWDAQNVTIDSYIANIPFSRPTYALQHPFSTSVAMDAKLTYNANPVNADMSGNHSLTLTVGSDSVTKEFLLLTYPNTLSSQVQSKDFSKVITSANAGDTVQYVFGAMSSYSKDFMKCQVNCESDPAGLCPSSVSAANISPCPDSGSTPFKTIVLPDNPTDYKLTLTYQVEDTLGGVCPIQKKSSTIDVITTPVIPINPWMMTGWGDTYVKDGVSSLKMQKLTLDPDPTHLIPTNSGGAYFSTYLLSKDTGNFTNESSTDSFKNYKFNGYDDSNRRLIAGSTSFDIYQYLKKLAEENSCAINEGASIDWTKDINFITGDVSINAFSFDQISKNKEKARLIASTGNITVPAGYDEIDRLFAANGSFITAADSTRYVNNGSIFAGSVDFNRSLSNNETNPAELIYYDAKYLDLLRNCFGQTYPFSFREYKYSTLAP